MIPETIAKYISAPDSLPPNPLIPNIHMQFLQTDLYTFP